jgi:hypothetical protein
LGFFGVNAEARDWITRATFRAAATVRNDRQDLFAGEGAAFRSGKVAERFRGELPRDT